MTVEGIDIAILFKSVRSIRMVVYPDLRVRVSAPYYASEDDVRAFVEKRIGWLRKTLQKMEEHKQHREEVPTLSPLEQLIEDQKRYQRLMTYLKPRFEYWRNKMGLPPARFAIRKMRTRWGSCTPKTKTIRFNLALADQSEQCIDYIIVHELSHLIHANHGPAFKGMLSFYMPDWREREKELKTNIL